MDVLGKERAREGGPRLQHRGGRDAAKSSGWFLSAGLNVSFPARATATGRANGAWRVPNGAWRVPNAPNGARRRRDVTRGSARSSRRRTTPRTTARTHALSERKKYISSVKPPSETTAGERARDVTFPRLYPRMRANRVNDIIDASIASSSVVYTRRHAPNRARSAVVASE